MDLLFWLVDPLPQEPGKVSGWLACRLCPPSRAKCLILQPCLTNWQAGHGICDPGCRRPSAPAAGSPSQGRIWLFAGEVAAAWWPRPARRCQGGGRPGGRGPPRPGRRTLAVPVGKHPGQRLVLETAGPQLVVHEAGGPLGFRQARMAVLQQQGLARRGQAGVMKREPPPANNPPAGSG